MKKKLFTILIILFLTSIFHLSYVIAASMYYEGTTVDVDATVTDYTSDNTITWDCRTLENKSVVVKNTGSESAYLRIRGRTDDAGNWHTMQSGILEAGATTMINLGYWYYSIELAVKDDSGHTSLTLDYGGMHP